MHIFHVITTISKGGAESHLVDLCRSMRERGVEITVAYLKGDGYWAAEFAKLGVAVVALEAKRYADLAAIYRLRRAIVASQPDIVHAHMPPAELYAVLALRGLPEVRLVTSKHNDQEPFYRGPGASLLERHCAGRAHSMIAISNAVRSYFAASWPERLAQKLVTIRYGISPTSGGEAAIASPRALREEWQIKEGEVLFGIVARLVEQKSISTLLQAFALLRDSTSAPVKLVVVGRGPLESELRGLAGDLGLSDAVVWAGFRTDVATVMRSLDVFVLSSVYEGFGLVLLEAMEASLPIVASRVSAIPEIVVEGKTGCLVPSRDAQALATAMVSMLNEEDRHRMGKSGHDRLLSDFAVDRMVDETFSVYQSVMEGGRTATGVAHDH